MKIYSVNSIQPRNITTKNLNNGTSKANQQAFKGAGGGVFGFMTGGPAGFMLTAAALTTPVGWVATAALIGGTIAGATAGAVVGNKLGDIVDPDEPKKPNP